MTIKLYDYWRSSAAYRVRIALDLKSVDYTSIPIDLVEGAQGSSDYRATNPQGRIPALELDGQIFTQSLAIIELLDARFPEPSLIPADLALRARVQAMAQIIACDIHPLNNLSITRRLSSQFGAEQAAIVGWMRHWMGLGFAALEAMADKDEPYLSGAAPGLADCCLIPQLYNARRFKTPLAPFPKLVEIDANCQSLDAFKRAHPDAVRGEA